MLKWFRDFNVRICTSLLPHGLWEGRAYAIYNWVGLAHILDPDVHTILDVGAGRNWYFGPEVKQKRQFKLIGVDDDADEMALNSCLDERTVGNASQTLGVPDGSIDLILSRATLEHLPDNAGFLRCCSKALAPGGRLVVVFTGKWAPPALLNRLLPPRLANKLLNLLVPGSKGQQGFHACYDKCSDTEFSRELKKNGFEIVYKYHSYFASSYYMFFVPLYILSIAIDYIRMIISRRDLASLMLYVAKQPE